MPNGIIWKAEKILLALEKSFQDKLLSHENYFFPLYPEMHKFGAFSVLCELSLKYLGYKKKNEDNIFLWFNGFLEMYEPSIESLPIIRKSWF